MHIKLNEIKKIDILPRLLAEIKENTCFFVVISSNENVFFFIVLVKYYNPASFFLKFHVKFNLNALLAISLKLFVKCTINLSKNCSSFPVYWNASL